ncbi:uncharacterized protein VTP21DRAFT_4597 [Calcarisporiella thermophila]|uniref:uncharacterized protein n=1 Tax=Calcarisporiella thermophila TaxID=911321 RepID=UPI00374242B7
MESSSAVAPLSPSPTDNQALSPSDTTHSPTTPNTPFPPYHQQPSGSSGLFPYPFLKTYGGTPTPSYSSDKEDTDSTPKLPPQRKRTRASPEQLAVLEDVFATNSSPNSKIREMLAERLGMSERSVQIWFQNRRAKNKLLHKRALLAEQEALRSQQFLAAMANGGGAHLGSGRSGIGAGGNSPGYFPYTGGRMPLARDRGLQQGRPCLIPNRVRAPVSPLPLEGSPMFGHPSPLITPTDAHPPNDAAADPDRFTFTCDTLTIGTWRRMLIQPNDLVCEHTATGCAWRIADNAHQFRMTFPHSAVRNIEYTSLDPAFAQVAIDLKEGPVFEMEKRSNTQSEWVACGDFTEGKQATVCLRHVMRGVGMHLKQQILQWLRSHSDLVSVASFDGTPASIVLGELDQYTNAMALLSTSPNDLMSSPLVSSFSTISPSLSATPLLSTSCGVPSKLDHWGQEEIGLGLITSASTPTATHASPATTSTSPLSLDPQLAWSSDYFPEFVMEKQEDMDSSIEFLSSEALSTSF